MLLIFANIAWKVSEFGLFSGLCFLIFGLNMEIDGVNWGIPFRILESIKEGTFNQNLTQNIFTCSKSTIKVLEKVLKCHWYCCLYC